MRYFNRNVSLALKISDEKIAESLSRSKFALDTNHLLILSFLDHYFGNPRGLPIAV